MTLDKPKRCAWPGPCDEEGTETTIGWLYYCEQHFQKALNNQYELRKRYLRARDERRRYYETGD